jgi:hypothetical protein
MSAMVSVAIDSTGTSVYELNEYPVVQVILFADA